MKRYVGPWIKEEGGWYCMALGGYRHNAVWQDPIDGYWRNSWRLDEEEFGSAEEAFTNVERYFVALEYTRLTQEQFDKLRVLA